MIRGRFAYEIEGDTKTRLLICAGSEWYLFNQLREISRRKQKIAWFESYGAPITPRSLAALNIYLEMGAIRFWKSKRWDQNRELFGGPEWRRFCAMLRLKFDGRRTREAA